MSDRFLNEKPLEGWQYPSRVSLVTDALENLDFDDLISVTDQELESVRRSEPEKPGAVSIYPHSAAYASVHGEMEQYRASLQANLACKEAIERVVSAHYGDNRLNTEAAVKEVLEKFDPERVQIILANTVQNQI